MGTRSFDGRLEDRPIPHRVKRKGDGHTLLEYLLMVVPGATEPKVRAAIDEGRFRWRGEEEVLTPDSLVTAGETLMADIPDMTPADPFMPPPPDMLPVLHHDAHLYVIDKPAGLLCYPLGPRKVAAQSMAERQLHAAGEPTELRPLHRIDRETSGVLMFARTLEADRRVKKAFQKRRIGKQYLALVRGRVEEPTTIDGPIGPEGKEIRIRMAVRDDGQEAFTDVVPLGAPFGDDGGYTWVLASPRTGRTHQIRLHLAHAGHPLVGDKLYTGDGEAFLRWWDGDYDATDVARLGLHRHALHAWTLTLDHPLDGHTIRLHAPVPRDLADFARQHGGVIPSLPEPA